MNFKALEKLSKENEQYKAEFNQIEAKLIEEMAELTQAIIKYDFDQEKSLEEVADVYIMLYQYEQYIFNRRPDLEEKLDSLIDFKIKRTMKRLKLED